MNMQNPRTFMHAESHNGERHAAILRILKEGVVGGQAELVRLLKKAGPPGHAVLGEPGPAGPQGVQGRRALRAAAG